MMVGLLSEQLGSTHLPVEVLWQAVLGVTYQYSAGHIPEPLYTEYCSFLKVWMDWSDSSSSDSGVLYFVFVYILIMIFYYYLIMKFV